MACRIHFNWLFKVKYLKDASSRKCKELCKISMSLFIPCGCDLEGEKQTFGRRVQSGNGSLYNVHCNHNNNNLWATCTTCTYWSFNHRRLDLVFKIFPLVNAWNMLSPSRWTPNASQQWKYNLIFTTNWKLWLLFCDFRGAKILY